MTGDGGEPYRVGYGRPPVASRFRKGASGNPKGRPKGSPSLQDLMAREARRHVKVKTADGVEAVPKIDVLVRKLYAKALEGDLGASRLIMQSLTGLDDRREEDAAVDPIDPMAVDAEVLQRMLQRIEAHFPEEDGT